MARRSSAERLREAALSGGVERLLKRRLQMRDRARERRELERTGKRRGGHAWVVSRAIRELEEKEKNIERTLKGELSGWRTSEVKGKGFSMAMEERLASEEERCGRAVAPFEGELEVSGGFGDDRFSKRMSAIRTEYELSRGPAAAHAALVEAFARWGLTADYVARHIKYLLERSRHAPTRMMLLKMVIAVQGAMAPPPTKYEAKVERYEEHLRKKADVGGQ